MAEPREQRRTYTVDHSPPKRGPKGGVLTTFWVTVQAGRQGLGGQAVEFLVNHVPVYNTATAQDGSTAPYEYEYVSDPPGVLEFLLEAREAGNAGARSQKIVRIDVRVGQAASIRHFKTEDIEKAGHVLIVLRVLDKDGIPVQGARANLRDKQDPYFIFPVGDPTDRNGMTRFSIPAEPIRDVLVLIQGIEERIRTTYV